MTASCRRVLRAAALAGAVFACSRAPPMQRTADTTGAQRPLTLDSAIAAGEAVYFRGAYDSARAVWTEALARARTERDSSAEARILTWLGNTAWRQGDLALARRLGEQALALKLRGSLTDELWRSFNALGLVARDEGLLNEAVQLFERAAATARRAQTARGLASAVANLALAQAELGDYSAARPGLLAARDQARRIPDARIEGNALSNLGMLEVRTGNAAGAISPLVEALRLYDSIGYTTGRQHAQGQLATAYLALGEPQRAIALLDSATRLAQQQGLRTEVVTNLAVLADIHRQAGDLRRAMSLFERARSLADELGETVWAGDYLRAEAEVLASLGNLPLARRHVLRAFEVHRAADAKQEQLADLIVLAEIAHHSGDRPQASRYLATARERATKLGTRLARTAVALAEARQADRSRDPMAALRALDRVRADIALGGYDLEWEAEALRARAFTRRNQPDSAVAAGRRAVGAVERTRERYGSTALRTSYATDRATAYADLVDALVRLGRVEEALVVADAMRGRALLEHMAAAPGATRAGAAELTDADRLLHHIQYLADQLDEATEPADVRSLADRLERARGAFEALLARGTGGARSDAALLGATPVTMMSIRRALPPDGALLEYVVADEHVLLFVVRHDTVRLFRTDLARANLEVRIRLLRGLLGVADDGVRARASLERLHEDLVGPAVRAGALRGARLLVVVPHELLAYVPFAALRDASTGRYLVEDYALLALPSAAALGALHPGTGEGGLPRRAGLSAFAPLPERLPASRSEVAAVQHAVPGAHALVGAQATEQSVREALERGHLVHVASHGVLNVRNPLFSRVVLRPDPRGATDGYLEVHELLGLRLSSPLVFLSGCETGLAPSAATGSHSGDEWLSLAQAFLFAGARNVVATLWPVEDEGAAAFAERFYRALAAAPPAEALATAQRQMLADPRFHAPYHWAPYVVTGSGTLAPPLQQLAGRSVRLEVGPTRP